MSLQVWVGTLAAGPQGVSLNSSYQHRDRQVRPCHTLHCPQPSLLNFSN